MSGKFPQEWLQRVILEEIEVTPVPLTVGQVIWVNGWGGGRPLASGSGGIWLPCAPSVFSSCCPKDVGL